MNVVPLFEEYRLIERSESDVNGAWKGAHLLLFFLAFVFGSFCTFCFHMLMYLFDEKCVLFPKLLSLTSLKHNVIYEFIPPTSDSTDMPVDFLSTQWVEKSTCSLPTYVPLVSGIFGLVWITMFLMCSTGSRTLSGLQRPWRLLPPVFIFSLAMSGLCIYSTAVTHYGLQELCLKLGEITGSSTCTYTVNVATLTYERRIRGVYQATRLTILSAWLHTACWLLSALLALVRILMAVDFQLVRVNVHLHGDIDKILEKHEVQIRTVSPEGWINEEYDSNESISKLHTNFQKIPLTEYKDELTEIYDVNKDIQHLLNREDQHSELSLVPDERNRVARVAAYKTVPKDKQFIVKCLYDLVDTVQLPDVLQNDYSDISSSSSSLSNVESQVSTIARQYGQAKISSNITLKESSEDSQEELDVPQLSKTDSLTLRKYTIRKGKGPTELTEISTSTHVPVDADSVMNLYPDMQKVLLSKETSSVDGTLREKDDKKKEKVVKKSNLKTIGVQTEKKRKKLHVQISGKSVIKHEYESDDEELIDKKDDVDKETQTREKEKQD